MELTSRPSSIFYAMPMPMPMPTMRYSRTSSQPRRYNTTVTPSLFLVCVYLCSYQNSFAVAFISNHDFKAQKMNPAPATTLARLRRLVNTPSLPKPLFVALPNSNSNGDESIPDESLPSPSNEQERERMEQIRHIQRSFYQDEGTGIQPPQRGSTIIKDLPLWRVQWTELPGYQNVLNVHVPHYTNMFLKILNSKDVEHRYFGHIYLPGGSENLDNEEYSLASATTADNDGLEDGEGSGGGGLKKTKASLTGVLMQISDYQQSDDGRLMLIVQALERFRVVEAKRHDSPHPIATVEIIPDRELVETKEELKNENNDKDDQEDEEIDGGDDHDKFLPKAVDEAFLWHPFEARPVSIDECTTPIPDGKDGKPQSGQAIAISPLMNFDANAIGINANDGHVRGNGGDKHNLPKTYNSLYIQTSIQRVMDLEYAVWLQLDELIRLLQRLIGNSGVIPNEVTKIPVPTQILGLLPRHPPRPWPSQFALEEYATCMEKDDTAMVGTASRSPFVRVDDVDCYPPLRRAQRLSYVIWILMDSIVLNVGLQVQDKQSILEMDTVAVRLNAAQKKLNHIGGIIRQVLNEA